MRPRITFLPDDLAARVIEEGFGLLLDPGIRIHNDEALRLLGDAGAQIERGSQIARIPESLARASLESAPREFWLYSLDGRPVVHYGGDDVQFDPGSAAISVLDSQTQGQRPAKSEDFARFVRLVEMLPQIDAQSTAMICQDVVAEIGDLYRLYLALHFVRKPIVTGAFRKDTLATMLEMLEAVVGGSAALAERPVAVFDVCPSPPLLWSDLTCQNLIDCARRMVPAELVSMPLAGATAPVTLAGAVVQHTAESLSGVVIGQLARKGSPIVWGGSPSIFDMRQGTTPMGDVGTWMIDCAYSEIGKRLGLPTHAYLGMTDAKIVDAQAGLESAGGVILAALAGVNMVSGAGMLDFESCQSPEKLVIDAEIIGMAKRLLAGIEAREAPIALTLMRELGHRADYLGQEHTLRWFQKEFYIPSEIIDRGSLDGWKSHGAKNTFERARERAAALLQAYTPPALPPGLPDELRRIATLAARRFGMDTLPPFPAA